MSISTPGSTRLPDITDGVPVSIWHQNMVKYAASALEDFPETRRIQTVDGAPPPLGWNLRQKDLAGTLRTIQKRGGHNLWMANHPGSDGTPDIRPGPVYDELLRRPTREADLWTPKECSKFYSDRAKRYMNGQRGDFLALLCRKAWHTLSPIEVPSSYEPDGLERFSAIAVQATGLRGSADAPGSGTGCRVGRFLMGPAALSAGPLRMPGLRS